MVLNLGKNIMKSRVLLYVSVFLFSVFFLTGCTSDENKNISENLTQEGLELYEERYYKEAMDKFVEALEKYPSNFEAYAGLADILLDKGFFEEVEDLANEASVRVDNTQAAEIYSMIGEKYYEIERYEKSQKMFEKAVSADGNYEKGRVGLAGSHIWLGDIREASRALGNRGESDEFLLLYSFLTFDDWEEGVKKVSEISDDDLRGRMESIYEIDDEDVLYKNTSLAREYINAGYPFLAIELLSKQDGEIEQYPDGQYFLGRAYLDYGNYERAIEKLNAALMLDVDDDEVYINLARANLFNNNVERALNAYEAVVSGENLNFLEEYIDVLLENDMKNKAQTILIDLIAQEDSFGLNIMLGKVYYERSELDKMGEVLEKLEEETNLTQAETKELKRYKILYAVEDIDNEVELDGLIERYSVFDRYDPEVYLFRGKLLKHQEEILEAQEAFERAIELDLKGDVSKQAEKLLASMN